MGLEVITRNYRKSPEQLGNTTEQDTLEFINAVGSAELLFTIVFSFWCPGPAVQMSKLRLTSSSSVMSPWAMPLHRTRAPPYPVVTMGELDGAVPGTEGETDSQQVFLAP